MACSSIRAKGFSVIPFADTYEHACYIGAQSYKRSSCEKLGTRRYVSTVKCRRQTLGWFIQMTLYDQGTTLRSCTPFFNNFFTAWQNSLLQILLG